jgi:glycosyltransferase involved in cell wall biosynthesis
MTAVSVIVPTFNRGYILPDAIKSVLAQTYPHFEIVVVDDGSTDDTIEVVAKFKDERIRVVRHSKNAGVSAARNTGLTSANGEFISFLDSDDLWAPDKLALELKFFAEHFDTDAIFSDAEFQGAGLTSSAVAGCAEFLRFLRGVGARDGVMVPPRAMYLCMLQEMPIRIQATTFRRERVQGGWRFREDWRSGEDWELLLRLARTLRFAYIDRPLVVMRSMSDSTLGRHQTADARFLTNMFIQEKRSLDSDPEARAAVRRAIASHSDRLGYFYWEDGETLLSMKAYLRGFRESGNVRLLYKALMRPIPRSFRAKVKEYVGPLAP